MMIHNFHTLFNTIWIFDEHNGYNGCDNELNIRKFIGYILWEGV
jgi:hypothetical protein